MRMSFRYLLATLIISALAGLFHPGRSLAQSGYSAPEWEKILTAARKEGRVVVYFSGSVATIQRITDAFKKKYPDIAADYQRASTGQALPRLEQERLNKLDGGDVWISGELLW